MAITLEQIKNAAKQQRAAGVSEADLIAYGKNIGLSPEEINYVLGKTATPPTKISDLEKVVANDAYITSIANQLGDKSVSAGEQLALSDPDLLDIAENVLAQKGKTKTEDLAAYGKKLGLNQDIIDYMLGTDKSMELGTGNYNIGSNVDQAVAMEEAIQESLGGKPKAKDLTPAAYLTEALKYVSPADKDANKNKPPPLLDTADKNKPPPLPEPPPLPDDWNELSATDKINWLNTNKVTHTDLKAAGVDDATIAWMSQNGYKGTSAPPPGAGDTFTTRMRYGDGMGGDRTGTGVAIEGDSGLRSGYAPYVQRMLERASAEADVPFQKYMGESPLLESARAGIANLTTPAQFQQGSNLATAAGIGALGYGQYKPTSFITGTFANPAFNPQASPSSTASASAPTGADKVFFQNFGRLPNETELGNLNTYLQSTPDYKTYQQSLKPPGGAAEGGLMSLRKYNDGGGVALGTDVTAAQPSTTNLSGQNITTGQPVPSLAPVNYGGQNVTNVQASYMSPYMQGAIEPALREAKRQSEMMGQTNAAKAVGAGAFGGSRHGLVEAERQRNLMTQLGDIQGRGLQEAYTQGMGQFNKEQDLGFRAQQEAEKSRQFGSELGLKGLDTSLRAAQVLGGLGTQQGTFDLNALKQMSDMGKEQQTFDYNEFLRGEKYPYENLRFMQSMLTGLPTSAAATGIDPMSQALSGGISSVYLAQLLGGLGGGSTTSDRRLKTNIQTIGVLDDGLKVYSYRYKSGGPVRIGVMADEVAVLRPQAYIKGGAGDGFDAVDYSKL